MAKGVHHKDKVTIRKGGRKPKANLSNTYGIQGGSGKDYSGNGRAQGAVTQPSPRTKNKLSKGKATRKIKG